MAGLDDAQRAELRHAISDPGSILPRDFVDDAGRPLIEVLPRWQTRAVEQVIGPWLASQPQEEARPDGAVTTTALTLAYRRLHAHLSKVRRLATEGRIPAARFAVDDVMTELDEINRLISEKEAGDGWPDA